MNIKNQKQVVRKLVNLSLAPIDLKDRERIAIKYLSGVLGYDVYPLKDNGTTKDKRFFDGLEYNDILKKTCFWFNDIQGNTKIIHD